LVAGPTKSEYVDITGTPTTIGSSTFTVTLVSAVTTTRDFTITVQGPTLSVTTATLPDGTVGTAYNQTVAATGGDNTYAWAVSAGTVPAGLSLDANTGAISGTPTVAGASTFTVEVTSGDAQVATKEFTLTVS
jgi:hypothetical protein